MTYYKEIAVRILYLRAANCETWTWLFLWRAGVVTVPYNDLEGGWRGRALWILNFDTTYGGYRTSLYNGWDSVVPESVPGLEAN